MTLVTEGDIKTCYNVWQTSNRASHDYTPIDRLPTADRALVYAAYQLGDFVYQIVDPDGTRRRRMTCRRPDERNWILYQIENGCKVVIEPPR